MHLLRDPPQEPLRDLPDGSNGSPDGHLFQPSSEDSTAGLLSSATDVSAHKSACIHRTQSKTQSYQGQQHVHFSISMLQRASQVAPAARNPPANAGDIMRRGLVPGSGRFPGGWHGNPLQDSCLENPMDRGAWWATVHGAAQSRTPPK